MIRLLMMPVLMCLLMAAGCDDKPSVTMPKSPAAPPKAGDLTTSDSPPPPPGAPPAKKTN